MRPANNLADGIELAQANAMNLWNWAA